MEKDVIIDKLIEDNIEYERINHILQEDKTVLKDKYKTKLSDALRPCYNDYKKIMHDSDLELWKTVVENIFEVLSVNGINFE